MFVQLGCGRAVCAGCFVDVFVVELTRFGGAAVLMIGDSVAVDLAAVLAVQSCNLRERDFSDSMTCKINS